MEAQGKIVPVVLCMPAIITILILYVCMYVYVTRDCGNSVFEIVQYLLPCTYIHFHFSVIVSFTSQVSLEWRRSFLQSS